MYSDDFKLTSSAVILAALLLAATDTKADISWETPAFWLEAGAKSPKITDIADQGNTEMTPLSKAFCHA